jgi:hypothetical protein
METLKHTTLIFDYWKHWMSLPTDTVEWAHYADEGDGLTWYDGYWATFWYMLNLTWFEMNDKMTSETGDTRTYYPPMDLCDQ